MEKILMNLASLFPCTLLFSPVLSSPRFETLTVHITTSNIAVCCPGFRAHLCTKTLASLISQGLEIPFCSLKVAVWQMQTCHVSFLKLDRNLANSSSLNTLQVIRTLLRNYQLINSIDIYWILTLYQTLYQSPIVFVNIGIYFNLISLIRLIFNLYVN